MYLIIDTIGDSYFSETVTEEDLEKADKGSLDIYDITRPDKPRRFIQIPDNGPHEWADVEKWHD